MKSHKVGLTIFPHLNSKYNAHSLILSLQHLAATGTIIHTVRCKWCLKDVKSVVKTQICSTIPVNVFAQVVYGHHQSLSVTKPQIPRRDLGVHESCFMYGIFSYIY